MLLLFEFCLNLWLWIYHWLFCKSIPLSGKWTDQTWLLLLGMLLTKCFPGNSLLCKRLLFMKGSLVYQVSIPSFKPTEDQNYFRAMLAKLQQIYILLIWCYSFDWKWSNYVLCYTYICIYTTIWNLYMNLDIYINLGVYIDSKVYESVDKSNFFITYLIIIHQIKSCTFFLKIVL